MFKVVIPARYASSRLPGKPLASIGGKSMIQHVYERAQASKASDVIVATDDVRIVDVVKGFGGKVCLTAETHTSGTDRIHEVANREQLSEDEIVVNVQGDEPFIPSNVINQVANNLFENENAVAATLSEPIDSEEEYANPNVVKVVSDMNGLALYFSRSTIPFPRENKNQLFEKTGFNPQRHIGIYAYRVKLLNDFVQWPVSNLERIESLEQLRILENGQKIHVAESIEKVPGGVDTPEDLAKLQALF
jgi:3-deoxy-manno-octulosonate cytidylyltransferase (CMP-KDO synthetase)